MEEEGRIRKLLLRTRLGGFARSAALLTVGTAAAQAFSVLAAPLLTRIYQAPAFGQLALFTSFIGVASVGISLKYELGIVSAKSEAEAAQLTYASVLLTVPMSILGGGILYLAIRSSLLGYGTLPLFSVLLAVGALVLIGVFTALRYWVIRQGRFAVIAKTTVWQHTSRAIAQVVFGTISAGSAALMLGELIGRAAGLVHLFRESWEQISELLAGLRMHDLLHTLNANRKLMVYSLPSTFIDTLVANLPVPLLVKLYGIEAGGYFALVQRVLAVPLGLIATSVADTFHSSLAICAKDNPSDMRRLFRRTSLWLFFIGIVPTVLLAGFGDSLFRMIFGSQWANAGTLAALSTPWFLTQFVVSPLSRLVFVLSGQEMKLVYDIVILLGMLSVGMVSFRAGWSLGRTVWAFSLINAIAYVIYYLILVGIINRATPGRECEAHG
jgi:O-antigen/teichoic acid export membrane protein